MSTADKLNKLIETKEAIRQSIIAKGTDVGTDVPFSQYPSKINEIQTGSGESYVNPDFYELRTNGGTDCSYLFYEYSGKSLDLSNFDASNVTNMHSMLYNCKYLKSLDLSNFNTSNVTNMSDMFFGCSSLTSLDLSDFNTSNVTNMSGMFNSCSSLTSLDLSGWDTSKVTDMSSTFKNCSSLTSLDLSGWDTSKVTTFTSYYSAIDGCTNLKIIKGHIDLSSIISGISYNSSEYMFKKCPALEEVYLTNIYKNSKMTNGNKWSINLKDTVVKDECLIFIINELPDLINDKGLTATDKIVLTLPPTNTLTAEQVQPAIDKGWTVANVNSDVINTASTYSLRNRITDSKVYKLVENENGNYQSQDDTVYDILEANNAVSPDGINVGWIPFENLEQAMNEFQVTYVPKTLEE